MNAKTKKIVFKKLHKKTRLVVEISQKGVIQQRRILTVSSLFKKQIDVGSGRLLTFSIRNSKLPKSMTLFVAGRREAGVVLSRALSGFVNTGHEHADVESFLEERLVSGEKELVLPLLENARGSLVFRDFSISFKLVKPVLKNKKKKRPISGAGLGVFTLSSKKTPLEQSSLLVAAVLGLLCVGGIYSLIKSSREVAPRGLTNLSSELQFGLIHPIHYEMMPIVYRNEYATDKANSQILKWVEAFMSRANKLEQGQPHQSKFEILNSGVGITSLAAQQKEWQDLQTKESDLVFTRKQTDLNTRYFKFIKGGVEFTTQTSGDYLGSIRLQQRRRIHQLNKAYEVIKSRYFYEFETLNAAYEKFEIKFEKPGVRPKIGRIPEVPIGKGSGIRYEEDFARERERIASAKEFFTVANATKLRDELMASLANENKQTRLASVAWLSEDSLVRGLTKSSRSRSHVDNLWKNAEMALDPSLVPTPQPPKAWIDMSEVHRVIFTKREQVKACYDSALRRNPELTGKLKLGWVVALNGKAKGVIARETSLSDGAFVGCIKTRLQTWQFPKPKNGEVFITYPFEFDVSE